LAELANRVQNALDEGRILILGGQILLGFAYRSFFERGFETLPDWARATKLVSLCVILVAVALVIVPCPFHRLAEGGEDSERIHRVATRCADVALFPFAVALGLDILVAAVKVEGLAVRIALTIAGATTAAALFFWYALPALRRRPRRREDEMQGSDIDKKIRHVLTEARMILPGAQAMLGFQLAVTLMDAFDELPRPGQLLHVGAMLLTALAVVLLIAPAAYHRIAEAGEETERFHRVAGRFIVAALVPLALSMSAELGIVTYRLTDSVGKAAALGGAALVLLVGGWFGFALGARASRRRARGEVPAHA
jgi:Family of unknown function (DUF6328)